MSWQLLKPVWALRGSVYQALGFCLCFNVVQIKKLKIETKRKQKQNPGYTKDAKINTNRSKKQKQNKSLMAKLVAGGGGCGRGASVFWGR